MLSYALLVDSVIQGAVAKAYAATINSTGALNFALINIGSPPRWHFDLPLNAKNGSSHYNPYHAIGNANVQVGGVNCPVYKSVAVRNAQNENVYLPQLWGNPALKELAKCSLFVRGIHTHVDGHDVNNRMLVAPQLTDRTILGLNSARTDLPFSPVINGRQNNWNQHGGHPPLNVQLQMERTLDSLLTPYVEKVGIRAGKNNASFDARVDFALEEFRDYAEKSLKLNHEEISTVQKTARKSLETFTSDSAALNERWTATLKRYAAIVADVVRASPNENAAIKLDGRLRDSYNEYVVITPDLRQSITASTTILRLAEALALVEFLLVEKLSSTICVEPSGISGVNLPDCRSSLLVLREKMSALTSDFAAAAFNKWSANELSYEACLNQVRALAESDSSPRRNALLATLAQFNAGKPAGGTRSLAGVAIPFDGHYLGASLSAFFNEIFYRGLAACLQELCSQLDRARLFDQTLIQVGGDFNRIPQRSGRGSEHGFMGSCVSFYSGLIRGGPFVIGNVVKQKPMSPGCWGEAAPITIRPASAASPRVQREIQPGDVANSVCKVLGIQLVSTNGITIFGRDGNTGLITLEVKEFGEV